MDKIAKADAQEEEATQHTWVQAIQTAVGSATAGTTAAVAELAKTTASVLQSVNPLMDHSPRPPAFAPFPPMYPPHQGWQPTQGLQGQTGGGMFPPTQPPALTYPGFEPVQHQAGTDRTIQEPAGTAPVHTAAVGPDALGHTGAFRHQPSEEHTHSFGFTTP